MGEMITQFENIDTPHEEKMTIYNNLMEMAPLNRSVVGRVAFYHAARGEWMKTVEMIDRFFDQPVRETPLSLKLKLLQCIVLHLMDSNSQALEAMQAFNRDTANSWYRIISKYLDQPNGTQTLIKIAGSSPEKLITAHTAIGLWAEGRQNKDQALHHYREALGTYLDHWNEYSLSLERVLRLKDIIRD